jgi:hypothetical protein
MHDAQLEFVKGQDMAYDVWKSLKDLELKMDLHFNIIVE